MKRKVYHRPAILSVELKQRQQLLNGSPTGDLGDPQPPEGGEQNWSD